GRTNGHPVPEHLYRPLPTSFDWRPEPGLVHAATAEFDRMAAALKGRLAAQGIKVYKSDLKKRLLANNGMFAIEDIREITGSKNLGDLRLEDILPSGRLSFCDPNQAPPVGGPVFWYKEWDNHLQDYLPDHVRVCGRDIPETKNNFYETILRRRRALIQGIRYAREYAMADTHQALLELRAKGIYAHGITVNVAADPKLDDLYGQVHHNVISAVHELPAQLLRIYRALTRD
ncbi:MAG: hypothetical protein JSW39_15720, partial [Desulfobacterales bacterium]